MKWVMLIIICVVLVVFVLPLRLVSQLDFVTPSKTLRSGSLSVHLDPQFYPVRRLGAPGLEVRSPYRLRVLFKPSAQEVRRFEVRSLTITSSTGKAQMLPPQVAVGPETNADGRHVFIVGYLSLPLDTDTLRVSIVVAVNGEEEAHAFDAQRVKNWHIVHAGVEALNGL